MIPRLYVSARREAVTIVKILFIHQNFPGQFKNLAPALALAGHDVTALTMRKHSEPSWQGVRIVQYSVKRSSTPAIHPWVGDFETKTIRAEACFHAALIMQKEGYSPDVIVAHHGWGESMFLKNVWPNARLGLYCEFFYQPTGADVDFDPEFRSEDVGNLCRLQLKNLNNLLHFEIADAGISPTRWQASTFPDRVREKISVVHDGIDTEVVAPDPKATLSLSDGRVLTKEDEVITFVNRNLEPYRGFHVFMRALPEMLRRRPNAHFVIVGGDGVSYGGKPPSGKTWKEVFVSEIKDQISQLDWKRILFVGTVPYQFFIPLLQLSRVHVYLTYPFVLSWSLLEAMSAGCAIVASDTAPLREAIIDGETGRFVDFFDHQSLANSVCELLENPAERARLGDNAREFAVRNYDLRTVCLPAQLEWVDRLSRI